MDALIIPDLMANVNTECTESQRLLIGFAHKNTDLLNITHKKTSTFLLMRNFSRASRRRQNCSASDSHSPPKTIVVSDQVPYGSGTESHSPLYLT